MLSVEVLNEPEGPSLAWLWSPTGWHPTADGTIRLWEDCYSTGFISGARPQDSGMDQPHQPGAIQQQSAW